MLVMFIFYSDQNCRLLFFRHQQNRPGIPNARKAYDRFDIVIHDNAFSIFFVFVLEKNGF